LRELALDGLEGSNNDMMWEASQAIKGRVVWRGGEEGGGHKGRLSPYHHLVETDRQHALVDLRYAQ
jgi:hypothetical protein